jgi:hypothetical protein
MVDGFTTKLGIAGGEVGAKGTFLVYLEEGCLGTEKILQSFSTMSNVSSGNGSQILSTRGEPATDGGLK